jgi:hypothetical protein
MGGGNRVKRRIDPRFATGTRDLALEILVAPTGEFLRVIEDLADYLTPCFGVPPKLALD